jgi:hypothetical protein
MTVSVVVMDVCMYRRELDVFDYVLNLHRLFGQC